MLNSYNSVCVTEYGLLNDISVRVNITHTYIGDLRVLLISPTGETVVLHDRTGHSANDIVRTYDINSTPALAAFIGDQIDGDWVLHVTDHANNDTGHLVEWEIKLSIQKIKKKTFLKEISPNLKIPDNNSKGIVSAIIVYKSGKIVNLNVSVDITHSWIGDLRIILVPPKAKGIVLHNRTGKSRNDINKTFSTKIKGPLQSLIGKGIKGNWKLRITDLANDDIGILNKWSIEAGYVPISK